MKENPLLMTMEKFGSYPPPDGLTLRDYFAAKAMPQFLSGLGAQAVNEMRGTTDFGDMVAILSYQQADAMLAQRLIH